MISEWLRSLRERERRFVIIGAAAAAVLLVLAIIVPLNHSVAQAHQRIERKRDDLAWMRSVQPQLAAAPVQASAPVTQESLVVVVDRAAREAGLGGALTSSEPNGQGGLRVRLEKAQFDILIGWLARLSEQNGIRVESATVDSAGAPGVVNAGIVLRAR